MVKIYYAQQNILFIFCFYNSYKKKKLQNCEFLKTFCCSLKHTSRKIYLV